MIRQANFSDTYGRRVGGRILVPTYDKFDSYVMRVRFGLKKFQRGILQLAAGGTMHSAGGGPLIPSASNVIIATSVSSGVSRAGIVFNESTVGSVGSMVKRNGVSVVALMGDDDAGSPVDHTGEWVGGSPVATEWEVSCTSVSVGAWDVQFVGVTFYTDFATSDMNWYENRAGGKSYTPGTDTVTGTFRIREIADTLNFTQFTVQATATQT